MMAVTADEKIHDIALAYILKGVGEDCSAASEKAILGTLANQTFQPS